jgi:hypothetical protein
MSISAGSVAEDSIFDLFSDTVGVAKAGFL